MFNLKDNGIDFYVNSRKELQKVLGYVEKLHDNIMICVNVNDDEIKRILEIELSKALFTFATSDKMEEIVNGTYTDTYE